MCVRGHICALRRKLLRSRLRVEAVFASFALVVLCAHRVVVAQSPDYFLVQLDQSAKPPRVGIGCAPNSDCVNDM